MTTHFVTGRRRPGLCQLCIVVGALCVPVLAPAKTKHYQGKPFHDSVYNGGPQRIPGRVMCAYYDLGGEGVAYHDADAKNNGSGGFEPAGGTLLHPDPHGAGGGPSFTPVYHHNQKKTLNTAQPPHT